MKSASIDREAIVLIFELSKRTESRIDRPRRQRMRAIIYKGPYSIGLDNVEDPRIEQPGDAIVKVTSSGICGSDLHMYEGRTAAGPGVVFGHEIMEQHGA